MGFCIQRYVSRLRSRVKSTDKRKNCGTVTIVYALHRSKFSARNTRSFCGLRWRHASIFHGLHVLGVSNCFFFFGFTKNPRWLMFMVQAQILPCWLGRQSVLYAFAPSQVCEVPTCKIAIEMSMNPATGIVFLKSLMESKSSVYQRKGASRDHF